MRASAPIRSSSAEGAPAYTRTGWAFKNDQIVFTMYADGGASLASPSDFANATTAVSYIGLSGAGGLGGDVLRALAFAVAFEAVSIAAAAVVAAAG